ncbi:hypothetical protein Poly41_56230 [Novipirellula artificiosorum]|uniref:Uncharacterized protein n=1 Tax=Novipirellula artificiosorum TaxID=2528016 RepID=A0A5C6D933_9BACT|nr:hypothetical protein Poly41_56230 [Novipirellula artificiosorum]
MLGFVSIALSLMGHCEKQPVGGMVHTEFHRLFHRGNDLLPLLRSIVGDTQRIPKARVIGSQFTRVLSEGNGGIDVLIFTVLDGDGYKQPCQHVVGVSISGVKLNELASSVERFCHRTLNLQRGAEPAMGVDVLWIPLNGLVVDGYRLGQFPFVPQGIAEFIVQVDVRWIEFDGLTVFDGFKSRWITPRLCA